jgi:hypothetical protein
MWDSESSLPKRGDAYRENKFLRGLSHTKNLSLTPYILKVLIVVLWLKTYVNLNVDFFNMVGL